MPAVRASSQWTKEVILREAHGWADAHGLIWRPELERQTRAWLFDRVLVATGTFAGRGHQAKELLYTSRMAEYMLNERGLRCVLNPEFRFPKARQSRKIGAGKHAESMKGLSKNARRKLKRYGKVPSFMRAKGQDDASKAGQRANKTEGVDKP